MVSARPIHHRRRIGEFQAWPGVRGYDLSYPSRVGFELVRHEADPLLGRIFRVVLGLTLGLLRNGSPTRAHANRCLLEQSSFRAMLRQAEDWKASLHSP
jgi:hypothetical protein